MREGDVRGDCAGQGTGPTHLAASDGDVAATVWEDVARVTLRDRTAQSGEHTWPNRTYHRGNRRRLAPWPRASG
jgi:hypothetical protein